MLDADKRLFTAARNKRLLWHTLHFSDCLVAVSFFFYTLVQGCNPYVRLFINFVKFTVREANLILLCNVNDSNVKPM